MNKALTERRHDKLEDNARVTQNFVIFLRPGEREETLVHTYVSSFQVPVRTWFLSSTLVGAVSDRHQSGTQKYFRSVAMPPSTHTLYVETVVEDASQGH